MGADQEATRSEIEAQQEEEVGEEADCPTELALFETGAVRWAHIKALRTARNYSGEPE